MLTWGKSSTRGLSITQQRAIPSSVALHSLALLLALFGSPAHSQYDNNDGAAGPLAELHIARVMHGAGTVQAVGWGRPMWAIDWPEAETHITHGVARMSLIDIYTDSRHLQLTDPYLFDYPWLFFQQPARGVFSEADVLALREYLLRGGFPLVDDFHGESERAYFMRLARRIFPDRAVIPIPPDDPIMSIHYDLNQNTQIPGERHLYRTPSGDIAAQLAGPQEWLGLYDDSGRLVLAAHFNMDMGDAWQHADDPWYPEPMTNLAYRFGVNYMIYAMTH